MVYTCLYHPFMVIMGMVYYCHTNITTRIKIHQIHTYIFQCTMVFLCNMASGRFSPSPRRRSATRSPPAKSSLAPRAPRTPRAPMGPSYAKLCQAMPNAKPWWWCDGLNVNLRSFLYTGTISWLYLLLCLTHISSHIQKKLNDDWICSLMFHCLQHNSCKKLNTDQLIFISLVLRTVQHKVLRKNDT